VLARHSHSTDDLAVGFGDTEGRPTVFLKRFFVRRAASRH